MSIRLVGILACMAFGASSAAAATVNATDDPILVHAAIDPERSLDLPGTFTTAPLAIVNGASMSGTQRQARSPFELRNETIPYQTAPGYYSVGVGSIYSSAGLGFAEMRLDGLHSAFSLLWGSPDAFNTLELLLDGAVVFSITGEPFSPRARASSFVTILADGPSEYFNGVRFMSKRNGFEFANASTVPAPVPLPAAGLMLIGGVGLLSLLRSRRNSAAL